MEKSIGDLISFICPTRKRPDNVRRLIRTSIETAVDPQRLNFLFYVDRDDTTTLASIPSILNEFKEKTNLFFYAGDRILMCEMSNILAREVKEGILFLWCDDIVIETSDWDDTIRAEFDKVKDKILLVYGDDGIMGEKLATHFFLHKNWIDADF